eukprot:615235-Amphidinium_carterae.1
MTLTSEQLIDFFTKVESLLTEFHSSKGYTTVLAPLVELNTKKPKANAADAGGQGKKPEGGKKGEGKEPPRGKKGEGKGKNDGKDNKKPSTKEGKPQNSAPPPGGPSAGGGRRTEGGKPSSSTQMSDREAKNFKENQCY